MKTRGLINKWTDFKTTKPKDFGMLYDVHIEIDRLKTAVVRDCVYFKYGFKQIDSKETFEENVIAYKTAQSSY
jgi:hypothetical protein